MYCQNCGKEVLETDQFCSHCGSKIEPITKYCQNCGALIDSQTQVCPQCGYQIPPTVVKPRSVKSKLVAGLLGIFLGGFGVHNFYLGYTSKGVIQVALLLGGFLTCGLTSLCAEIWGFVEGILILIGNIDRDVDGNFLGE